MPDRMTQISDNLQTTTLHAILYPPAQLLLYLLQLPAFAVSPHFQSLLARKIVSVEEQNQVLPLVSPCFSQILKKEIILAMNTGPWETPFLLLFLFLAFDPHQIVLKGYS